jgi:hypothetical protein
MACIERRCKLFGLDAPTKIAPTNPEGTNPYRIAVKDMSDEQLRLIASLRHQLLQEPPPNGGESD